MSLSKSNRKMIGYLFSYALGLVMGYLLDDYAFALVIGTAMAIPMGSAFAGEELIKDKTQRRQIVFVTTLVLAAGCLAYGYVVGDIRSGIGAAIGLSFVIGLKGEKLYDERTSNIFNKATRDAFVFANIGFTYVGFFHEMVELVPAIEGIPVIDRFVYVLVMSWMVFLVSWLFHHYLKGE